jgi:hypothetical protein
MRHMLLFGCVALSACTNTLNFRPTMAADPPVLGIEGIALATQLSKAYTRLDGDEARVCQNLQLGYQERRAIQTARYKPNKDGQVAEFRCVAFKADPKPDEVKRHVQAGLALTDYFCANFFERIAEHAGKRRFARNTTNDVGALVSTVLGLASAGSGVTGGIGAGFGLADSGWRNYDENFLVSADLPVLQRHVFSEQALFRKDLKYPDNYFDGTNMILRYANLCSFVGMKSLLVKAMEDKTKDNEKSIETPKERLELVRKTSSDFLDAYDAAQQRLQPAPQPILAPGTDPQAPLPDEN